MARHLGLTLGTLLVSLLPLTAAATSACVKPQDRIVKQPIIASFDPFADRIAQSPPAAEQNLGPDPIAQQAYLDCLAQEEIDRKVRDLQARELEKYCERLALTCALSIGSAESCITDQAACLGAVDTLAAAGVSTGSDPALLSVLPALPLFGGLIYGGTGFLYDEP